MSPFRVTLLAKLTCSFLQDSWQNRFVHSLVLARRHVIVAIQKALLLLCQNLSTIIVVSTLEEGALMVVLLHEAISDLLLLLRVIRT